MTLAAQMNAAMYRWFRQFVLFFFVSPCLFFSGVAQADLTETIRQMNTDTLVWRVHVTDPQGLPVPGATIWRMIPNGRQRINPELMQRLVRRYSSDKDFVMDVMVHPSLMVGLSEFLCKRGFSSHLRNTFLELDSKTS